MGRLRDDASLVALYSAADVMCVPSIQESFGLTAIEAMACGTPVVAFGSTGLLDIVQHGISGYLAKPFDELDLAYGIEFVLRDESRLRELSSSARRRVQEKFELSRVAELHLDLYEDVLARSKSTKRI